MSGASPGRALICGSVAFDTIMVFGDRFANHILPDKIHMLNVSFLVPQMRREYGGCAGNIAYNLRLLGGEGLIMATVGHDFGPYAHWLRERGIALTHVRELPGEFTAQAYITTDLDGNQITAFHPGAMNHAHVNHVNEAAGVRLGIIAPDGRQGMLEHAAQFAAAGIPYMFDPGQALPLFNGEELRSLVERASWVAVNDYEASLLSEHSGWSAAEIAGRVKALVITRGGEGSVIHAGGTAHEIPVARPAQLADPTGCGDAYRAGLLYGLQRGLDWPTTGRIAALAGAIKIEHHGTQHHQFDWPGFAARYRQEFGASP